MKSSLAAALLFLLPFSAFGWNLKDHRDTAKLALTDVMSEWGLDAPCKIRPLDAFLEKLKPLRPEIADAWQFSHFLKVDPKLDLGTPASLRFPEGTPKDATLTPIEILALYATDPDDGRDQNLFLRDEHGNPLPLFPDQKWFGSVQGPNSQAFRHIEKPPFSVLHPFATLGFPLRTMGEATQRAEIYFQISQLAFALDEDYWGWRFLAGGLHYLQDLHQPYHSGQITPLLAKKGLAVYFSWGAEEKGFIESFAHVVSNSHRFFETYIDNPRGHDQGLKDEALKALAGKDLAEFPGSVKELALIARDTSNPSFGPLAKAVGDLTGESLYGREEFFSDGDRGEENSDPKDFLRDGPEFDEGNRRVFEIVKDRFGSLGRVTRTYVKAALEAKGHKPKPHEILKTLNALLPVSPDSRVGGEDGETD